MKNFTLSFFAALLTPIAALADVLTTHPVAPASGPSKALPNNATPRILATTPPSA